MLILRAGQGLLSPLTICDYNSVVYSDAQKSVPVKLARLLPYITTSCCFDSHPRIDSALQKLLFRYGLLESAMLTPI
jgi:hypothetical protein